MQFSLYPTLGYDLIPEQISNEEDGSIYNEEEELFSILQGQISYVN